MKIKIRKRFTKVIGIFLRILLDLRKEMKIRKRKGFEYSQKVMAKTHIKRAWELYHIAIYLGGMMIKLCQYLSTRRDMLPEAYVTILSQLQDNVPPVAYADIKTIIDAEYTDRYFPFASIDETPLASASLGQAHRAKLKTGEDVVLKVLKPEVEKIIDTDSAILFYVFRLFSKIKAFRDFSEFSLVLEEFFRVTGDELNFKREVEISKRFKKSFVKFDYVKVPYVYEKFSNRRIIVMEFIDGVKITDVDKWAGKNNDPAVLSRRLIELYFEQFITMKIIHFDPHPGNIYVLENNNIALLDFCMSGEITEAMSGAIKDSLVAFARKDYVKLLELLKELGFLKKSANIYLFLPIVEYFFDEILETVKLEQSSMEKIDLSPVVDDLVEIIYTQPFRLPYEWAYIGKTIGTLTGIISTLYPDFKLYDELKPYFDKLVNGNIKEIVEKGLDFAKTTFNEIVNLPHKVDSLVNKIERGQLKFHVDFEDVDDKIMSLGATITRGISVAVSFFSGIFAYILHIINRPEGTIVFGGISLLAFFYFLLYRKKTKREIIKKTLMK
jgi:predicted unusual protein kinase regulating ubiquinone biosynthesis (AarF/ABC1/UbiB family)